MFKGPQKTIQSSIHIQGKGLHSGIKGNLYLKPAEPNTGILFKRTDVDRDKSIIEASYKNVVSPILCTKIQNSHGTSISTIELMVKPTRYICSRAEYDQLLNSEFLKSSMDNFIKLICSGIISDIFISLFMLVYI